MTDLHGQIMNLPCVLPPGFDKYGTDDEHSAYKFGHREARHAAAELASAEIERNRAAIAELVDVMNQLCIRIWNEGASPLDWNEYDAALAVITKHDTTTTKEQ